MVGGFHINWWLTLLRQQEMKQSRVEVSEGGEGSLVGQKSLPLVVLQPRPHLPGCHKEQGKGLQETGAAPAGDRVTGASYPLPTWPL